MTNRKHIQTTTACWDWQTRTQKQQRRDRFMKALVNHQLEMTICSRNKLDGWFNSKQVFKQTSSSQNQSSGMLRDHEVIKTERISGNGCYSNRGNSRRSITDEDSLAWLSCGTLTLRFSQFHWRWVLEAMIPHSLINQAVETTGNDGRWSFHLTYSVCTYLPWGS